MHKACEVFACCPVHGTLQISMKRDSIGRFGTFPVDRVCSHKDCFDNDFIGLRLWGWSVLDHDT